MKDTSVFEGVVNFHEAGTDYQAIRKNDAWDMAAMEQQRVLEQHTIVAPVEASPGVLLTASAPTNTPITATLT